MGESNQIYLFKTRFYSNYAVTYPDRQANRSIIQQGSWGGVPIRSDKQAANESNLKRNNHRGYLSAKASKRLGNAINWLIACSNQKTVRLAKQEKTFTFKICFITLTLPFDQGSISDNTIRKELLHPLLALLRKRYNMRMYVWKSEVQENGNLHFHLTTNVFIPSDELRFIWNRLITKKGFMNSWSEKMKSLSFDEYRTTYWAKSKKSLDYIRTVFDRNRNDGWTNPNSTDIHSIKNIKDLGAYLASYMSKKGTDRRPIVGRIWGSSENLSDKIKCELSHDSSQYLTIDTVLNRSSDKSVIVRQDKEAGEDSPVVAIVYFYKFADIMRSTSFFLRDILLRHVNRLKNIDPNGSPPLNLSFNP